MGEELTGLNARDGRTESRCRCLVVQAARVNTCLGQAGQPSFDSRGCSDCLENHNLFRRRGFRVTNALEAEPRT